jgi:hypothetical protein
VKRTPVVFYVVQLYFSSVVRPFLMTSQKVLAFRECINDYCFMTFVLFILVFIL